MNKRYLMVEVLHDGTLDNIAFDDCTSPDEARNNIAALRQRGIAPTGVYAFVEVTDDGLKRVNSLTETIRSHFLGFKNRAQWLR